MKNKIFWSTNIFILVAILPLICLADFNISDWKYFKDVAILEKGVEKIVLDDEIFSGAKNDFSDLRLIDINNKEIPYKLVVGKKIENQNSYSSKLINNSYIKGKYSTAILDLGEKGKVVNSLTIGTNSENFQRNTVVYGSDNMNNWNTIKDDAYIYDYTDKKGDFKSQNTKINFPDSLWRYYKLEISDEYENPIKINSVSANNIISERIQEVKRKIDFISSEDEGKKTTQLLLDLNQKGIPFNKIDFGITGGNFNRQILIYSSNDKNNWDYVGRDYIFSYNTSRFKGEKTIINFSQIKQQYIKLEILNNDNESLEIKSLNGFYVSQEIIFQSEKGESIKLFYGNNKANFPQYDFDSYFQYLDLNNVEYAKISSQNNNSKYLEEVKKELPLSERIPFLLPIILISISMLLIILVYKFMKE